MCVEVFLPSDSLTHQLASQIELRPPNYWWHHFSERLSMTQQGSAGLAESTLCLLYPWTFQWRLSLPAVIETFNRLICNMIIKGTVHPKNTHSAHHLFAHAAPNLYEWNPVILSEIKSTTSSTFNTLDKVFESIAGVFYSQTNPFHDLFSHEMRCSIRVQ